MLLSIIVPVYNAEMYLNKLLDQLIVNLDNYEVILVNDGSKDSSGKICDEYAQKNNQIKVIHKKNEGVSTARNMGIQYASGEYLVFFDSDDCVAENAVIEIYNLAKNRKYSFFSFGYDVVVNDSIIRTIKPLYSGEYQSIQIKDDFYKYCNSSGFNCPCNKIFSKEIIVRNGIKFPNDLFIGEDAYFVCEYINHIEGRCFFSDKVLYHYVQQEYSATHKYQNRRTENELKLIFKISNTARMFNNSPDDIRNIIDKKFLDAMLNELYNLIQPDCNLKLKEKSLIIKNLMRRDEITRALKNKNVFSKYGFNKKVQIFFMKYHFYVLVMKMLLVNKIIKKKYYSIRHS